MIDDKPNTANEVESKPPVFKTWNALYWIVIIVHIALITLFTLLTKAYS